MDNDRKQVILYLNDDIYFDIILHLENTVDNLIRDRESYRLTHNESADKFIKLMIDLGIPEDHVKEKFNYLVVGNDDPGITRYDDTIKQYIYVIKDLMESRQIKDTNIENTEKI